MIALKDKDIDEYNFELDIDKNVNWQTKSGQTKELDKLYNEIYKDGSLTCEIEYFYNNGLCEIKYTRDDI